MVSKPWTENDEQRCERVPGGSSSAVHTELYSVAGLRLVQLPCRRQDVPAQHSRQSWNKSHSDTSVWLDHLGHTHWALVGQRPPSPYDDPHFNIRSTVPPTRRASSTLTTLRSLPDRPTLSTTATGAGSAVSSRPSSERPDWNLITLYSCCLLNIWHLHFFCVWLFILKDNNENDVIKYVCTIIVSDYAHIQSSVIRRRVWL